jgi:type VI secretion system protein ImpC
MPIDDTPFRILIIGDFTGRRNRSVNTPIGRPVLIDLDNFEDVMAEMRPALHLPIGEFRFRELDDFHPDRLYRQVEVRPHAPQAAAKAASAGPGLLDSILDSTDDAPEGTPEEAGDLSAFIKRSMKSSLESRPDPTVQAAVEQAATSTADRVRAILHHAAFQHLEAAWRATWMLVHGLGDDVKIYILDSLLDELLAHPAAVGSKEGWAIIVGNYTFRESPADAAHLMALGRLAQSAGAPFLADALPPSDDEICPEWQELRKSSVANSIGLILPRFLLRLPYGKTTNPVETFQFEEMKGSVHQQYLWGNPAFACAYLLGQSFRSEGWDLRPGSHRRNDGLPLHVYREDGASVNKPCAEILMSEKDAQFLMEHGYMPLASMKDQDAVLLVRFQSIADPPAALAGGWSS